MLRSALARIKPWMLVILWVSGLALWLRLHSLGRESLWLDEGYSWRRAGLPVPALIADAVSEHHNPSYFLFLHYWLWLGDDEFMLRLPSALSGTLAAAAAAALGCIVAGPAAGLIAGTLLGLAPVHVQHGQEARMYAMLTASATIAAAALIWLGTHLPQASYPILGLRRLRRRALEGAPTTSARLAWAAYVAGMVFSLYMHNTAAVFVLVAGCAALALLIRPFEDRIGFVLNFIAANLAVLIGWAPYLRTQLQQVQTFSQSSFWARFPTTEDLVESARELYLLTADWPSPLAIVLVIAAAAGLWSLRKRPEIAVAMLCLAALGPVALYLISFQKPIYGTRLLLWSTPPFFALVGAGVAVRKPWIAAGVFIAGVAWAVQPRLELNYLVLKNEPWREVVWTIRSRVVAGARVLTATNEEAMMFDYYMHRRSYPLLDLPVEVVIRRKAWTQIRDAPRMWLVDRRSGQFTGRARYQLAQRGQQVWDRSWNRRLRVVQYDFAPK